MEDIKKNRISPQKQLVNFLVHLLLAVLSFIWVLPIIWIVLTSFRAEKGAYTNTFLPQGYTLDNYIKLFTDRNVLNFPKMFTNFYVYKKWMCNWKQVYIIIHLFSIRRWC